MITKKTFDLDYWHIGIITTPIEYLIQHSDNVKIDWIRYKDRDRFFADPFLLKQDSVYFYILAEEYMHTNRVGQIVLLFVDKKDLTIKKRKLILSIKSHLSFPCPIGNKIYPENSKGGTYSSYDISNNLHRKVILDKPCFDPVQLSWGENQWLFTSFPSSPMSELYVFLNIAGKYHPWFDGQPIVKNNSCARMAGNFFKIGNVLYRPAQDCSTSYGEAIRIMQVDCLSKDKFKEHEVVKINPPANSKYNKGLHTFNVYDNVILVDGYCRTNKILYKSLLRILYHMKIWK